jgi:peptidoglycan hydrolase-like protein with peptidoglycan-binding domain
MEPIVEGMNGAAVEDIQDRLAHLGYDIPDEEHGAHAFGHATAQAVAHFRVDHNLSLGTDMDSQTWAALVDETYEMGDRTLYLRLPNFHGNDVRSLQTCLNILGFSCGETDGCYGVHTEAAVKQFQENVGVFADGMAFQDTFDAIERLHHVWAGKPAAGPHPMGPMGFARAARVLEGVSLSITACDPISRNVAGRIWNLATATADASGIRLVESASEGDPSDNAVLVLACKAPDDGEKVANVVMGEMSELPMRIRTACGSTTMRPPTVRIQLPCGDACDGTFTTADAQTLAVMLLDAICTAFSA